MRERVSQFRGIDPQIYFQSLSPVFRRFAPPSRNIAFPGGAVRTRIPRDGFQAPGSFMTGLSISN